jgi:hypothetical protein
MARETSPLCPFAGNTKVANCQTDGFNKASEAQYNNTKAFGTAKHTSVR